MPYVNIRVTKEGITAFVVIDEVETDNWGVGGEAITEIRRKAHP